MGRAPSTAYSHIGKRALWCQLSLGLLRRAGRRPIHESVYIFQVWVKGLIEIGDCIIDRTSLVVEVAAMFIAAASLPPRIERGSLSRRM